MYTATITVRFDAAHRLLHYEGKCKNLHGHSYVAVVSIESKKLEASSPGFVMDFGVLKRIVKGWIDKNWDHTTILNEKDLLRVHLYEGECKVFSMKADPTAENMALHLYKVIANGLHHRSTIRVGSVTIKETPTAWATYQTGEGE